MAAIYCPPWPKDLVLTTTPYPVDVTEAIVFGVTIVSGTLKPIPAAEVTGTFGMGADGTLEQLRWFFEDGPYDGEVTGTFGMGDEGTLVQLRWFFEDGPYPSEVTGTFGMGPDGSLESKLVQADTGSNQKPYEELQLGITIDATCTMDLI